MSKYRRSFFLFIVFVIVVLYLYYESISEKKNQKTFILKDELSDNLLRKKSQTNNRHLLMVQSISELRSNEQKLINSQKQNFSSINKGRKFSRHARAAIKKRLKRETSKELFNWKFNVNVTKLVNESFKSSVKASDSDQKLNSKATTEKQSLSLAVYVEGIESKQSSNLNYAWNSVGEFLKNLFGNTKNLKPDVVNIDGLADQIDKKVIFEEQKEQSSAISKSREGKLLGSLFNFGSSNKENPPFEQSTSEILGNKSQTEVMHDLIFITTSSSNDQNSEGNTEVSPPSISTEMRLSSQDFDALKIPQVLNTAQSISDFTFSGSNAEDQTALKTTKVNVSQTCQNCSLAIRSIDTKSISVNSVTESLLKEISTDTIILKPFEVLKSLCVILQNNNRVSPRFLDLSEEGSGSIGIENQVENFKANTTQIPGTTIKYVESQESQTILWRAWNTIRSLSFRNERKLLERTQMSKEDSEDNVNKVDLNELFNELESKDFNKQVNNLNSESVLSLPKDFSLQDCRQFFIDEGSKSSFSTRKEIFLNEDVVTEQSVQDSHLFQFTEKILLSSDSLISNVKKQDLTNFRSKSGIIKVNETILNPAAFQLLTETVPHISTAQSTNISEIILKPDFEGFTESVPQNFKNDNFLIATPQSLFITNNFDKSNTTTSKDLIDAITFENLSNIFPVSEKDSVLKRENLNKESTLDLEVPSKTTGLYNLTKDEGRIFSDFIEDILEVGSLDERVFNFFSSGERELKNEENESDSTITLEQQQRFIPNLFGLDSGSREIQYASNENELDFSTDNQIRLFGDFFDIGSGERSLVEFSLATTSEPSKFTPRLETISQTESITLKSKLDIIDSEIEAEETFVNTFDLNTESLIDGFSSGDLAQKESNESSRLEIINALGNVGGRQTLESSNETSYIDNKVCLNCSEYSFLTTTDCENCGDKVNKIDKSYVLPESKPKFLLELNEPEFNQSSVIEKFIEGTPLSNINVTNETSNIVGKYSPNEEAVNDTNHPITADLLTDSEIQSLYENDQIISPESESPNSFGERGGRNYDISPVSIDLSDRINNGKYSASEFEHSTSSKVLSRRDGRAEGFPPTNLSSKDSSNKTFFTDSDHISQSRTFELSRRRGRAEDVLPFDWPNLNTNNTLNSEVFSETEIHNFLPSLTPELAQNYSKVHTFTEVSTISEKNVDEFDNVSISEYTSSSLPKQPGPESRGHDFFPPDWLDFVTKADPENLQGVITETSTPIIKEKDIAEASNFDKNSTVLSSLKENQKTTSLHLNYAFTESPKNISYQTLDDRTKHTKENTSHKSKQDKSATVKVISVESNQIDVNINPKIKPKLKLCRSARECDHSLNERCFSNNGIIACSCPRNFVRNPKNRKCEAPIVLQTSVKLPGEHFVNDLKDKSSWHFQQKRMESIETMWLLLQNDPKLFLSVAEIDVDEFEEGSLLVKMNVRILLKENETISDFAKKMDHDLKAVFEDEKNIPKVPLNISSASALTSTFCDPNYCGDHGECRLSLKGEKHCLCLGWYFGESCEISGIIVLASFTAANVLLILVVLVLVLAFKKKRKSLYGRDENCQSRPEFLKAGPSRIVADVIALDGVGPIKFANMSTPIGQQLPMIQVTRPSFPGSDIEYDSAFDRRCFSENSKIEYDGEENV